MSRKPVLLLLVFLRNRFVRLEHFSARSHDRVVHLQLQIFERSDLLVGWFGLIRSAWFGGDYDLFPSFDSLLISMRGGGRGNGRRALGGVEVRRSLSCMCVRAYLVSLALEQKLQLGRFPGGGRLQLGELRLVHRYLLPKHVQLQSRLVLMHWHRDAVL